jgi:hypothetical protein
MAAATRAAWSRCQTREEAAETNGMVSLYRPPTATTVCCG